MAMRISDLLVSGETEKEKTRREIAKTLLYSAFILEGLTLAICGVLVGIGKFSPENFITAALAVSSIFSGLLGAAITFYYSSNR